MKSWSWEAFRREGDVTESRVTLESTALGALLQGTLGGLIALWGGRRLAIM